MFVGVADVDVAVEFPEMVVLDLLPPLRTVKDSDVVVVVSVELPVAIALPEMVMVALRVDTKVVDERVTVVVSLWYVTPLGIASASCAVVVLADEASVVVVSSAA